MASAAGKPRSAGFALALPNLSLHFGYDHSGAAGDRNRWHRRGLRALVALEVSAARRPTKDRSRTPIQRMSRENPLGGAPRTHGELLMLGVEVSVDGRRVYGPLW
jgi:hypothetical protein